MCGIFAYLNYQVPVSKREILDKLVNGLKRLEYRGYDSAGVAFAAGGSCDGSCSIQIKKETGKVAALEKLVNGSTDIDFGTNYSSGCHVGIAHTRWATHGEPSPRNAHPHRSDENNEFALVHNGIVTNYKDIKAFLVREGVSKFESETDTEVVVKLMKHIYDTHTDQKLKLKELVEMVVAQMEGAFAMVVISKHYPGEMVAARRGSPLLIGVKSRTKLTTCHVPVLFSKEGGQSRPSVLQEGRVSRPKKQKNAS